MSEHKTGQSNWTEDQKQAYHKRREDGVCGQVGATTAIKIGTLISRGKTESRRANLRQQWREFRRQERKGSTRGN